MAEIKVSLPQLRQRVLQQQYSRRHGLKLFYRPRFVLPTAQFNENRKQIYEQDIHPYLPPYPYGKDQRFPEANYGLYGGQTVQSGHKISKGRNKGKTVRKWFPNVKVEELRSEALGQKFTIPVTARVKRTIRKCGGLDQYILGTTAARIKELGVLGWKLRWMMLSTAKGFRKFQAKDPQMAVSVQKLLTESFSDAWKDAATRDQLIAEQVQKWAVLREKTDQTATHLQQRRVTDKATRPAIPDLKTLRLHTPRTLLSGDSVVVEESLNRAFTRVKNELQKIKQEKSI